MRKCNRSSRAVAVLLAADASVCLQQLARADVPIAQFTPGDLLVMRGGDAVNRNGQASDVDYNGETTAFIDEYTQSGYYVGTLNLSAMTLPGTGASSHEGNLDISPNGQWVSFGGYDPNPTVAGTIGSPVGATPHDTTGLESDILGEVNLAGGPSSLNMSTIIPGSTSFPNSLTGQYLRSALTLDGNEFYFAAKYNETAGGQLETNDTGLDLTSGLGNSPNVTVLEGGTDWRNVQIFNGQLYGGTGSSSVGTHGVYQIGTGIPTTNNPIPPHTELTNYPGGQSASSFGFADVQTSNTSAGTMNGFNVLYTVGDQSVAGITKYYYDTATQTWNDVALQVSLNSNDVFNPTGLVAQVDPTNPAWIDLTVSGSNGIYTYIDKSGNPQTALPSNAFTQLVTPASYASFYGMTQDPGSTNSSPANVVWSAASNHTWDVGTSANWNYANSTVDFANGENVTFDDTATNANPVSLNTTVSPNSIAVETSKNNYTISGSGSIAGSGSLRLLPGNTSTFTLATANSYSGGTTVSGGLLEILPTSATTSALPKGALTIDNTGTVQLAANVTQGSQPGATPASNVNITSLSISGNGTLDVTNNHILIDYGSGPDPIASISALVASGYNGGKWNGLGINSSTAAANSTSYGLGYADSADQGNPAGLASGTIEIKYTLLGDANLSGVVDGTDFGIVAANFNKGVSGWDQGDFNYDRVVDGSDFGDLAANFNKGTSGAAVGAPAYDDPAILAFATANGLLADVPEPASVGLVAIAGLGLLSRRRRSRN